MKPGGNGFGVQELVTRLSTRRAATGSCVRSRSSGFAGPDRTCSPRPGVPAGSRSTAPWSGHLGSTADTAAQAATGRRAHRTHGHFQHTGPDHVRPYARRRRADLRPCAVGAPERTPSPAPRRLTRSNSRPARGQGADDQAAAVDGRVQHLGAAARIHRSDVRRSIDSNLIEKAYATAKVCCNERVRQLYTSEVYLASGGETSMSIRSWYTRGMPLLIVAATGLTWLGPFPTGVPAAAALPVESGDLRLWYDEPAPDSDGGWIDRSIPMGNGALGV